MQQQFLKQDLMYLTKQKCKHFHSVAFINSSSSPASIAAVSGLQQVGSTHFTLKCPRVIYELFVYFHICGEHITAERAHRRDELWTVASHLSLRIDRAQNTSFLFFDLRLALWLVEFLVMLALYCFSLARCRVPSDSLRIVSFHFTCLHVYES